MTDALDRQRIDRWLWHARVVRTRGAADRHDQQETERERNQDSRTGQQDRKNERGPSGPPRFERREKAPDPNSPFAKLAALKAQLEADAKERR